MHQARHLHKMTDRIAQCIYIAFVNAYGAAHVSRYHSHSVIVDRFNFSVCISKRKRVYYQALTAWCNYEPDIGAVIVVPCYPTRIIDTRQVGIVIIVVLMSICSSICAFEQKGKTATSKKNIRAYLIFIIGDLEPKVLSKSNNSYT